MRTTRLKGRDGKWTYSTRYQKRPVGDSPELVALTDRFILEDLANFDQMAKDNYGIQDAPQRVERFRGLIIRWRELLSAIDANDVEAVTKLYKTEIWDKVDAASHGM